MKLQQLVYVTKVAECGSITEAARRLYVSQPSITSAIHDLEQEMNVHIFDRTNKGVVVSEEGETFLGYARQVLEQTELLEGKLQQHSPLAYLHSPQIRSLMSLRMTGLIRQYPTSPLRAS